MNTKSSPKIGVLITNLGTPCEPTPKAVKKYLAQFLSDPFVVRIPRVIWWLILYGLILRIRPKKSAKLYQKIWTSQGSPLLTTSTTLVKKIQSRLQNGDHHFEVVLGMRYGKPSLKQALISLQQKQIRRIIVLPLYPQYSTTTTASTKAELAKQLKKIGWQPTVDFIDHYFDDNGYIEAITKSVEFQWRKKIPGQMLLFSFHGIPKKLVDHGDPYYDQCMTTAQTIAKQLNLEESNWKVVFQSRFGKEKWLQPYCDQVLQTLPKQNYKRIDIICPGFAVDCLETLEEIAMTNKKLFHEAGGTIFNYIGALNDSDKHADVLSNILLRLVDGT